VVRIAATLAILGLALLVAEPYLHRATTAWIVSRDPLALIQRPEGLDREYAVDVLIDRFNESDSKQRCLTVAVALGGARTDTSVRFLCGVALDPERDEMHRRAAAHGLRTAGVESALPSLVALSEDPDYRLRRGAVHAIAAIRTPDARQALIDIADREGEEVGVVLAAVSWLRQWRDAETIDYLEAMAITRSDQVAVAASGALFLLVSKCDERGEEELCRRGTEALRRVRECDDASPAARLDARRALSLLAR
jgi:HEAT repeat protein